jgi:hypothetical protein
MTFSWKKVTALAILSGLIPDFLPIPLAAGCLGVLAIVTSVALYMVSSDK